MFTLNNYIHLQINWYSLLIADIVNMAIENIFLYVCSF